VATFFDEKSKQYLLYLLRFDENGKLENGFQKLDAISAKNWVFSMKNFVYAISNDSSAIAISRVVETDEKDSTSFSILSFRLSSSDGVGPHIMTVPIRQGNVAIVGTAVSRNGVVAITAWEVTKGESKHHCYVYNPSTKMTTDVPVTVENGTVQVASPYFDDADNPAVAVHCIGSKRNDAQTLCYAGVDVASRSLVNKKSFALPADLYFTNPLAPQVWLHLINRVTLPGGKTVFVFEDQLDYATASTTVSSGKNSASDYAQNTTSMSTKTSASYAHIRGAAVISCLDASGEQLWVKQIPKYQIMESSDVGLSFGVVKDGGNGLFLVYNDYEENLTESNPRKIKRFDGSGLLKGDIVAAHLDEKGELKLSKVTITNPDPKRKTVINPKTLACASTIDCYGIGYSMSVFKGTDTRLLHITLKP